MNDTPFPEGARPQPEDESPGGYPPLDPQAPDQAYPTLEPTPAEDAASGAATPPPLYQTPGPAGLTGAGFTPVLAQPVTGGRRRGPVWPWVVGAIAAVALICGLGFVAGMAINAAHGAAIAATPTVHPGRGEGYRPGEEPGIPHRGNVVTVTGVSGDTITATGPAGATLTITVTSQTVITGMDHQTAKVSDITVGERIGVAPLSVSGTNVTARRIVILPYMYSGTVTAVTATTITVARGQQTQTITITSATSFKGEVTSISGVMKGMLVIAQGPTLTNGALNATAVLAGTPPIAGKVTSVTATTITVTDFQGAQRTIAISASTQFKAFPTAPNGTPTAATATVQPGNYILAQGTLDSNGNFTAQSVTIIPAPGARGWGGPPNSAWPGAPSQPQQSN